MKKNKHTIKFPKWAAIVSLCFVLANCSGSLTGSGNNSSTSLYGSAGMWVSAYLGAWNHYAPPGGNWGSIHTDEIDWNAFTQLIYFSTQPDTVGNLSPVAAYQTFSPSRLTAIVTAAHEAKKPILFTVGGWGTHAGFSSSITPQYRQHFINNLVDLLKKWKFDGIDLDMEPINQSDVQNYIAFVKALHNALQSIKTPMLSRPRLTAATKWQPDMYAQIQSDLDQINLMTYDFSGAWPGWVSWYNAPVFDNGQTFSNGNPLPSANQMVDTFIASGVTPRKLGIGIDFYGYIWMGVNKPLASWSGTPPIVSANIPYWKIMQNFYKVKYYHWDDSAKAAYLSIENDTTMLSLLPVSSSKLTNSKIFISYDDQKSIQAKVNYVRDKKIGGVIIWELGGGFFANNPAGEKDPLLQDVKKDVFNK